MATLDELLKPAQAPAGQTLADLVGPTVAVAPIKQDPGYIETGLRSLARGGLGLASGVGAASEWAGDVTDSPNLRTAGRMIQDATQKEISSGVGKLEGPAFEGTFVENPSVKRAVGLVAEAVPSLALAVGTGGLAAGGLRAAGMAAPKALAVGSGVAAAGLGVLEGAPQYIEAKEAGKSIGEASAAGAAATVGTALLEYLPISKILGVAGKGALKGGVTGALTEGLQEGTQTVWQNLVAKVGYDDSRNLATGLVESMIGGAGAGGVVGAVVGRTDAAQHTKDRAAETLIKNAFPGTEVLVEGGQAKLIREISGGTTDLAVPLESLAKMVAAGVTVDELFSAKDELKAQVDAATTELPNMDDPDNALAFFEQSIPKEDQAAMADVFANIRQNNLHKGVTFPQQLFNMVGGVYESRTGKKLDILGGVNDEAAAPKFARLEDGPDTLRYNVRGKDYAYAPLEGQTVDDLRVGVEGKSPAAAVNWLKKNSQLVKEVPNVQTDQVVPEPVVPQAKEVVAPVARGDEAVTGGVQGEPVPAAVPPEQVVAQKKARKPKGAAPSDAAPSDAALPEVETDLITPAEDTLVGKNMSGEALYDRADGSRYRMRTDRADRPGGYLDFGGDLAPVAAEAPKLSTGVKTKGQRPSKVKAEIEEKYGSLEKVIASGKLNILRASDGMPEGVAAGSEIYSADGKTVVGAYVGGKVYLVADAIAPGEAPGVFLHEVAHRLLDQDTAFKSAKAKIVTDFGKLGTKAAKDARDKVPANTPAAAVGEEGLAYFLQTQEGRKSSLWRRLVVAVRSGLRRLGLDMQYTEDDILEMFTAGARSFVQTGGVEGTSVTSPAMMSMREAAKAIFSKLDQVSRASFLGMKAQGVVNFLTKQGVKKAEMEAVGLNEWLAARKPTDKVTQAELVDFVKANTVELEDVVLGGETSTRLQWQLWDKGRNEAIAAGDDVAKARWERDLRPHQEILQVQVLVDGTKFNSYQEPGAVEGSYREMFVTAPGVGKGLSFDDLLKRDGSINETNRKELAPGWEDGHSQYSEVKNPIVRIRFNEVNADGKRLLRIEEMQGPNPDNQAKMPAYLKDNIYQLGVKRILAYAKENGFDGVALATKPGKSAGETQADRYSLEKQISQVSAKKWGDSGKVGIVARQVGSDDYTAMGEFSPSELDNVVGKELANKIRSDIVSMKDQEAKVYSGLDLKVGGEGLKQLYDNQIPKMLEAYGKGKMETAALPENRDLRWDQNGSSFAFEGPTPTLDDLKAMKTLTRGGPRDIFDNPFTGQREDWAINRASNYTSLRNAIEAVEAGTDVRQALAMHGGASLFGITVTRVFDAATMPYLPLTNAPASYPMFSLSNPGKIASTANDALSESRKKVGEALLALASPRAKGRELYEKYAPQWLSVTSLHHVAQVFGKNVPQIKSMDRHVDDLVTTKTAIIDRAYAIHKAAEKAASDKDGSGVAKFNRAALTGTFNQMTPWSGLFEQDWVPAEGTKADRLKEAAKAWSAAGMNKSTGLTFQEAYRESADAFNSLSPMEQIQLQRMVEDTAAIRQRERTNLLKRIELLSEGSPELRQSLMLQFNASFNNLKGMYLPLSRFGDFILEYTNAKGQRVLEAFPDAAQRKAVRETLASEGVDEATVVERVKDKNAAVIAGMPQELMSQLTRSVESKFLASVDPTDEMAVAAAREHAQAAVSDMNQTFFRWLPDTSAMKNSVRRKNIQGASDNMLRGYLDYIQRHAVAIAWSEVGSKIEQDIQGLANENAELRKSGLAGEGPVNLDMRVNLLNDMRARVKAIRTTNVGGLWSGISKLNTGYFMTSPSAFFVQMTQIPTLTLPKLGAMFGWGKSSKALAVAGREAFSKKFSAEAMLADPIVNALYDDIRATVNETNRREWQALGDPLFSPAQIQVKMRKLSDYQLQLLTLREAMDRNLLDISAAHEAFELTRGGDPDSKMSRLFRAVMLPMQHGELASRKTAVLATLDLALKSGKGLFGKQNQDGTYAPGAIDDIHEVVKGTLFSYAKEDMGAATQGGAIRTILQFQKFRVFTGLRIARLFLESVKGIPSAERAAARKEFVGIMGMSTLIGGVKGTIYAAPIMAIANLLFGWDDDDKPYSAELDFTNWMEETFGKTAGDAIAHGPMTLMGTNISRRVGLGDIYGSQAEPPPGLHGAALASWWAGSLLGPTFSVAQGWFKGYDQMMNKGNYMRGLEDASPKPVKDALKAFRFATEGVKTGDGRKILSDDEIGVDELLTTFFGFQSDEVARAQAANAELGKMSTVISERRGRLIRDAAEAILSEDGDIEGAIAAVTKHAQKMPRYAITASEIKGAIAKRIKGEFGVTGERELGVAQDYDIGVLGGGE
jgi:hypothetical protein